MRTRYRSLNGAWQFTVPTDGEPFTHSIEVPFCPESKLSGIGYTDFIRECEYRRTVAIEKPAEGERVVLHFGAVDYEAHVYVNGRFVGKHRGGYTPFAFDIAPYVEEGDNEILVKVYDDTSDNVPSGKQSARRESYGCFYTRTTGIWQPVWLERTPRRYVRGIKYFTHPLESRVDVELCVEGEGEAEIVVSYEGREVGRAQGALQYKKTFPIELSERQLWEPGAGRLYDVTVKYACDEVSSYFGLREVRYEGRKFLVNGKSVFQRFVLDQGYYPDGLYTARDDAAMVRDIELGFRLGFNGARLHQKVFEPRFLYHCDRLGYMVWGEFPSWGVRYEDLEALGDVLGEWAAAVERDCNHPSIVTWCPLNETWENLDDASKVRDVRFVDAVYEATKRLDGTRPCVDVSGGYHGHATDVFDFHCYHSPEKLAAHLKALSERDELVMDKTYAPDWTGENLPYAGQPTNASEYGGMAYAADGKKGWGYSSMQSEDAFVTSYVNLTSQLLDCEKLSGFCYTQLYDIEQEQNGLLSYDRSCKLSESAMQTIAECNKRPAKIEQI